MTDETILSVQAEERACMKEAAEEETGWEDAYRAKAKDLYHQDGEVEIDENAEVSVGDGGAYVQAWVWVCEADLDGEE